MRPTGFYNGRIFFSLNTFNTYYLKHSCMLNHDVLDKNNFTRINVINDITIKVNNIVDDLPWS